MSDPICLKVTIHELLSDEAELVNMMEQCIEHMKRSAGMSYESVEAATRMIAEKHKTPVVNTYE